MKYNSAKSIFLTAVLSIEIKRNKLNKIKIYTSSGPDDLPVRFIKLVAEYLTSLVSQDQFKRDSVAIFLTYLKLLINLRKKI